MIKRAIDFSRIFIILAAFLGTCFYLQAQDEDNLSQRFKKLREKMVGLQIEARGIKDGRLLETMLKVERHKFVPLYLQTFAYQDRALPIGADQTISQPYIVALMTELLELKGKEKVLEIGTGSGYQAAILSELAEEIYTIEIIPQLAKQAENLLIKLGYDNVHVLCGDGYLGWPEHAPFDAIIVTCAPPKIPEELIRQLKIDGRMVIPVGENFQLLKLIVRKEDSIHEQNIIPVMFVPMIDGD